MFARNETIFKWTLYAAATLLCIWLQGMALQRLTIWGVVPFISPLRAAFPATYEAPVPGTIFALCVGVVSDLLLPAPLPCFYTLIFPLVGLAASLLSQSVLPAGFVCSIAAAAAGFLLTDAFHCLLLWIQGKSVWATGSWLMLRELLVYLPLIVPMTLLYRAVFLKTHMTD